MQSQTWDQTGRLRTSSAPASQPAAGVPCLACPLSCKIRSSGAPNTLPSAVGEMMKHARRQKVPSNGHNKQPLHQQLS